MTRICLLPDLLHALMNRVLGLGRYCLPLHPTHLCTLDYWFNSIL